MKLLSIFATAAVAAIAFASPATAASFNCYGRLTLVETVICANPGLSNLDSQMAGIYYQHMANAPRAARNVIRRDQKSWLGGRNACGASVGCLRNAYNDRINELYSYGD